jgi:predicted Holliday junction resolvase-like endonuclease
MSVFLIVIAVVVVLLVALAIGGFVAMSRRTQSQEGALLDELQKAERELAQAHAADKGWDRALLEAAARSAAAERFGAVDVRELQLVQVIDKPGTDADQAVFRVQTGDDVHTVTLGRSGGVWGPA